MTFIKNRFLLFLFTFILISTTSCDKEFEGVGSQIIDDDGYLFEKMTSDITLETVYTGPVETSDLNLNSLGVLNHPVYGLIDNSFVTQLELAVENPVFGADATITDVVLNVPYFSTYVNNAYKLDSIHGDVNGNFPAVKLSVYESGYYMKEFEGASLTDSKKYYSDQESIFLNNIVGERLNNSADVKENDQFVPSNSVIQIKDNTGTTSELAPGMYLHLNKEVFQQKLINSSNGKLINNNAFKEHLRGLFFKVEQQEALANNQGVLMQLDFSKAFIKVYYTEKNATDNTKTDSKTLDINLKGDTANFFNNKFSEINNSIRGSQGSFTRLKLFTDTKINELAAKNMVINEANLIFEVDETIMGNVNSALLPQRLFLYDSDNYKTLIDYDTDLSSNGVAKQNKLIFDGKLQKYSSRTNTKYKFIITKHVHNIIKNESPDVYLGLSLTENIALNTYKETKKDKDGKTVKIPVGSVISPFGVVMLGNTLEDKKAKLEIFYSTPKNN